MRKHIQSFFILCVIGLTFERANAQHTSLPAGSDEEIQLCQLRQDPKSFLNKEYELDAVYNAGFEMGWLEDTRECSNGTAKDFAILYKYDSDFKARSDQKALKKFNKLIKAEKMLRQVHGRFRIRVENYKKAIFNDVRYEFQIVILAVVSVAKVQPKSAK